MKLYHVTERASVESIAENGFRPLRTISFDDDTRTVQDIVWFSTERPAELRALNRDWKDPVVLVAKVDAAELHHEKGHPPNWVYVVSPDGKNLRVPVEIVGVPR